MDALELAMETFVRAYFNIGKFRPAAKFATWLYHIALNLCRDHLRSRAYQDSLQTVSFDAPTEEGQDPSLLLATEGRPDQKTDRLEELIALEKAISELPEELKNAFILTTLEDRAGRNRRTTRHLAESGRDEGSSCSQTALRENE